MKRLSRTIRAVLAASLTGCLLPCVGVAEETDRVLNVRSGQTLEQIVKTELRLPEFISQIAAYNGITSVGAVLPTGTTITIPGPYIEKVQHGRIAYLKGDVIHKQTDRVVNPICQPDIPQWYTR